MLYLIIEKYFDKYSNYQGSDGSDSGSEEESDSDESSEASSSEEDSSETEGPDSHVSESDAGVTSPKMKQKEDEVPSYDEQGIVLM